MKEKLSGMDFGREEFVEPGAGLFIDKRATDDNNGRNERLRVLWLPDGGLNSISI